MKSRRLLTLLTLLVSIILTACGGTAATPTSVPATSVPATVAPTTAAGEPTVVVEPTVAAVEPTAVAEQIELTYWSMWNENENQAKAIQQWINDFQTANPNIK